MHALRSATCTTAQDFKWRNDASALDSDVQNAVLRLDDCTSIIPLIQGGLSFFLGIAEGFLIS